jgi:hypothetical protein
MARETPMIDLVKTAAQIAKTAHEGQYRMGKEKRPYIVHPALVADLVEKLATKDEKTIAAAWLHDVIEDTAIKTEAELEAAFLEQGYNDIGTITVVAGLIREMSMPDGIEWKRIRSYQIDKISEMTPDAKILKIADQVANVFDVVLYPPTEWSATKIRNYFFKATDICAACAEAAPRLYQLFLELCRSKDTLSKNDISGLIARFAIGSSSPELPQQKKNTAQPVKISEAIVVFCNDTKHATGARIDLSDQDMADRFREYVEETGVFSKTLPLQGHEFRELVFSAPVDLSFCKEFALGGAKQ